MSTDQTSIEQLSADGAAGLSLFESAAYRQGRLAPTDVDEASRRILAQPDGTSFQLLMALVRDAPEAAAALGDEVRASVLAGALRRVAALNDFGYLAPDDSWDGPAGLALVAAGSAAAAALRDALHDERPAPLYGSETAAMSERFGYRRCDFAYRYAMLSLGRQPAFAAAAADRDQSLARLRAELAEGERASG